MLSGLEGLLEIVGFEVMAEGVRACTQLEGWRERIPHCSSFNAETAGAKQSADIWDGQQTDICNSY